MEYETLYDIIDNYFNINPPPYFSFDFNNNISNRKLKIARKLYADFNPENEKPLLLIDDTVFRSAKLGVLITNNHIFYRLLNNKKSKEVESGNIPLSDVYELRISTYKMGSDIFVNGKKIGYMIAFGEEGFKKSEAELLNKLFEVLIVSFHSR